MSLLYILIYIYQYLIINKITINNLKKHKIHFLPFLFEICPRREIFLLIFLSKFEVFTLLILGAMIVLQNFDRHMLN